MLGVSVYVCFSMIRISQKVGGVSKNSGKQCAMVSE